MHHIKVALRNLFRNAWMTTASITTILVGLFIAGLVIILISNVNYFVDQVESELLIKVFLEKDLPLDQKVILEERIGSHPLVEGVRYIDTEEGKKIIQEQFGEDADVLEGLDLDEILWDGYEITVYDANQINLVAQALEEFEGIDEIVYGKEYISDLLRMTEIVKSVGIVLALIVSIASTFVIFNTVRLTVMMRKDEISIMRYVGATNWFIRWPFILEGWIIGLLGALLASGGLIWAYNKVAVWFVNNIQYVQIVPIDIVTKNILIVLCVGGSILGVFGSTLSMRKFLRL
jgi:cell division transport system permease protein